MVQIKTEWALPAWYPGLRRNPAATPNEGRKAKRKLRGKKANPKALKDGSMIGAKKAPADGAQSAPAGGWREFLKGRLAAGKTMQDAAAEWKAAKQG